MAMEDEKLIDVINKYKGLKHEITDLNSRASLLEEVIKSEMTLRNVEKLLIGPFKVNYTENDYEKFDRKEFKRMYYELYTQFVKNEKRRYFSIT